jgi:hypothetical protein
MWGEQAQMRRGLGSGVVKAALGVLLVLFFLADTRIVGELIRVHQVGIDFLPLWMGARVEAARVYDFAHVTAQQVWFFQGKTRPFVYPPTALLFLKPLGLLGFWPALTLVVVGSAALFVVASRRIGADWRVLLVPPVLLVAVVGQLTLLVGGLVMLGLTLSPLWAGVAFGIAGAIKPQTLVLLPLALLVERNFKAFAVTGLTAAVLMLASLATGASWGAWLDALPRFQALVAADPALTAREIAPYARFGLAGLVVAAGPSLVAVWFAFRTKDSALKSLALLGGAVAVSPYAMSYDLSLLAAPLMALLLRAMGNGGRGKD